MPIHGVLVERDQQVDPVAHVGDFVGAGADSEKRVAAANDGLVGVVDVQMESATAEDFRENITWGGNALSGGAPYSYSEGLPHRFSPGCGAPGHTAEATGSDPVKQ